MISARPSTAPSRASEKRGGGSWRQGVCLGRCSLAQRVWKGIHSPRGAGRGRPLRPAARVRGSPGQWAGGVLAAPANGGAPQCRAALLGAAAGGGPWQRRGGDGRSGGAGRTRRPQVSGACGGPGDGRARAGTASPGAGMSGPAAGPGRAEPHGGGHAGRRCPGNTRDSRAALLCAWLFNADVQHLNTCRLNRFCRVSVRCWFLGAAVEPLCPSQWSSGCLVSLSVCLCKEKKEE